MNLSEIELLASGVGEYRLHDPDALRAWMRDRKRRDFVDKTTTAQEASGATVAVASSRLGEILVDAEGRTLYAFTKDKGDQSACSGECATNWPALTGTATAGTGAQASLLSTSMQPNGTAQVTYDGRPLYYFAGDAKPGDTNGQGVGDVWFVLTADGALVQEKAAGGYP